MSIAHQQASAAAATPDKTEAHFKGMILRWLLSHGQAGTFLVGIVLVVVALLSQAQNIESTLRMLSQLFSRWFGSRKPEPDPPPPPTPSPLLTKLPASRKGFLARAAELQQLAAQLAPEAARVVIHGMPGVGKTSLALHYAHFAGSSHPGGAWWFSASEGFEPMVLEAVSELEVRIPGLGRVEGLSLEARLRRCFEAWPGEEREAVLLVVDNLPSPAEGGVAMVERLTTGLPRRFRCLFTQRALPTLAQAALKLPVLASAEALELLRQRSGESGRQRIDREEEQARLLVEEVGCLPLALVLLGGRLERVPSLKVFGLRKDLAGFALEAKAFSERNAVFLGEQGLVATLLSSWITLGAEAQELARLLSLTLAAPIPWELIARCAPPQTPQAGNRYWEDGLAELVGANLLDATEGDRSLYGLHPLVREFFISKRQGWEQAPHWRREMGTAARALASEWQGEDLVIAVDFWRHACEADPADAASAYGLGYGLIPLGDSEGAKQAFEKSRHNAEAAKDPRAVSCAFDGIGDVLVLQGDGPGALAAYQAGLTVAEGLAKRDPANTLWQRDRFVSNIKMGDVLLSQGDSHGAQAAYQAGLTIAEGLAQRNPANMQWQRDLFISQSKVVDVLTAQGDRHAAIEAYRAVLATNEGLAKCDPANTDWQRDLWVSNIKMGDVLVAQGNGPEALGDCRLKAKRPQATIFDLRLQRCARHLLLIAEPFHVMGSLIPPTLWVGGMLPIP